MSDDSNSSGGHSPVITLLILFGFVVAGSTLLWVIARPPVALLYGVIRSVELPFINGLLPHGREFHMSNLQRGHVPGVWTIYKNSLFYGMFWFAMTFVLMFVALSRLEDNSISKHVNIVNKMGRTVRDVLERYATTQAPVRFFIDYDVVGLPTQIGTARQPFTALEVLLYTDAIQSISLDPIGGERPKLNLDRPLLTDWFRDRFGNPNPFTNRSILPNPRLMDVEDIHRAVDQLSWQSVLIFAPAVKRIVSFYSEKTTKGLETRNAEVENFIEGVWREVNTFKQEFGDDITLGAADDWDKAERIARRANFIKNKKKAKAKGQAAPEIVYEPYVETDAKSDIQRIYETGQIARGEKASGAHIEPVSVGPQPSKVKPTKPERLLFFGEVLAERGPTLKSVEEGREILKDYLTRHLGSQRGEYPVGIDPKTEVMVFDPTIRDGEQQAFNQQAQERLNTGIQAIERCVFSHAFEFGAVGATLDKARESGIMPPSLFRYLRFCDDTQSLWWFIHNLGMPSAVPENAGLFEHYQAERLAGTALTKPYIKSAIDGLKAEAEKYLTDETVHELNRVLGGNALQRTTRKLHDSILAATRQSMQKGDGDTEQMESIRGVLAQFRADSDDGSHDKAPSQDDDRHDDMARNLMAKAKAAPVIDIEQGRRPVEEPSDKRHGTKGVGITTDFNDVAEHMETDGVKPGFDNLDSVLARMAQNAIGMDAQRVKQAKAERDHNRRIEDGQTDD